MVGRRLEIAVAGPIVVARNGRDVTIAITGDRSSLVSRGAGAPFAVGAVASQPLANRHARLAVGPLADEPDGLAVRRTFFAVGLASGTISKLRLARRNRSIPGSGVGRGRGGGSTDGLIGDGRGSRRGRLAKAGGSGTLPAGTGLVRHDSPFSCSIEISVIVEPRE